MISDFCELNEEETGSLFLQLKKKLNCFYEKEKENVLQMVKKVKSGEKYSKSMVDDETGLKISVFLEKVEELLVDFKIQPFSEFLVQKAKKGSNQSTIQYFFLDGNDRFDLLGGFDVIRDEFYFGVKKNNQNDLGDGIKDDDLRNVDLVGACSFLEDYESSNGNTNSLEIILERLKDNYQEGKEYK